MTASTPAPGLRSPADAVVRLAGVSMTFGGDGDRGRRVEALRDIDLAIARGEFISLIGPSGCGKSTLLRIVGDLITPSAGSVTVNDKPARRARLDRDYGMVFQSPVLFDWRTVQKNVELPLEIIGRSRPEREAKAREMLDLVELGDFASQRPWQLSGGMQQRVAIARALALDPAILLMDEPFGALDEMTRERMNLELHRIWERTGTTVIFVTHSIPEAVFLSTRVVVMSARPGRITRIVPIDLPRDRDVETREKARYFELVTEVREALRARDGEQSPADAAVDATNRARAEGIGA
jgi:NitT/TauT family transport system ATP-binding protein